MSSVPLVRVTHAWGRPVHVSLSHPWSLHDLLASWTAVEPDTEPLAVHDRIDAVTVETRLGLHDHFFRDALTDATAGDPLARHAVEHDVMCLLTHDDPQQRDIPRFWGRPAPDGTPPARQGVEDWAGATPPDDWQPGRPDVREVVCQLDALLDDPEPYRTPRDTEVLA